ncbi:MAG: OmpA family protein [Flavobacteriaceae bacterium]|nr:OmpA family protein [Flavobacteriaceae bacterium]
MKTYKNFTLFICLFSMSILMRGQTAAFKKANAYFKSYNFNTAATLYENLLKKGIDNAEIRIKLADAYFYNSEYQKAVTNYLSVGDKDLDKLALFRLAKSLDASGAYEKAQVYYDLFNKSQGKNNSITTEVPLYEDLLSNPVEISKWTIGNTAYSEYPSYAKNGELYFVSNRDKKKGIDPWTNTSFLRLFKFQDTKNNATKVFSKLFKYHEGSAVLSPKGSELYVTMNIGFEKSEEEAKLKIVRFNLENGNWKFHSILTFCNDKYNTAHPTLSEDGSVMYFTSDRPGGYGESDLYKVTISEDGTFSKPENLGKDINTIGRESFPKVIAPNELVFASDGHKGYGGYDLFGVNLGYKAPLVVNLGKPVNSPSDDFQWVITTPLKGYFASNRVEETGDDIYTYQLSKPLNLVPYNKVLGKIVNLPANLKDVILNINDSRFVLEDIQVSPEGNIDFNVRAFNENKVLGINVAGYEPFEVVLSPQKDKSIIDIGEIRLKKSLEGLSVGDNLAKFFDIETIYFEFDKWGITPKAHEDLVKIAELMKLYPNISIAIKSHTDSFGTDSYNTRLSENRAKSTFDYLVSLGIENIRMTFKGYGESELIIKCNCSEEEQQGNRRSEFIITKI